MWIPGHGGFNLRREPDEEVWPDAGHIYVHVPASNDGENYDTTRGAVREWLAIVLQSLATAAPGPILLHCRAGRDRTGIVVLMLLCILIGPDQDAVILDDFLLTTEAPRDLGVSALSGFSAKSGHVDDDWIALYFKQFAKSVPIRALRERFLADHI